MMSSNEFKLGQLQGRLDALEADMEVIKKNTEEISRALTTGKGVLVGLMVTASGLGALAHELFKRLLH